MASSTPIYQLVDNLPANNMTVYVLRALDVVIPGTWQNLVGFDMMVQAVTGETDPQRLWRVRERAIQLYDESPQGYRRTMWLYQTVDKAGTALGAAAMANKVGDKIGFLSFLKWITPKADTAQAIDLSLKFVVELLAFCQLNGISVQNLGDFGASLGSYRDESLLRIAALMCFDGLLPLGPDFSRIVMTTLNEMTPSGLEQNAIFQQTSDYIPGETTEGRLTFMQQTFASAQTWMDTFLSSHGLSSEKIVQGLQQFIEFSDDRLDYLSAFLDIATNYFAHTGTQTVARRVIERAYDELQQGLLPEPAAAALLTDATGTPIAGQVTGDDGISYYPTGTDRIGGEILALRSMGVPATLRRDNDQYFVTLALRDAQGHTLDLYFVCSERYPYEPPTMFVELNGQEQHFIPPVLANWTAQQSLADLVEATLLTYQ